MLFSGKWGKTKWTAKEEKAIKDRVVDTNWKFLIIVKLYKKVETPDWYPSSEQWVDYEDYGIIGVARVIENKVRELGGIVKNESIIEKAERIAKEKENLRNIRAELEKEHVGIQMANDEKINLFNICKERINSLSVRAKRFYFIIKIIDSDYIQVIAHPFVINIHWWQESSIFLEGSHLDIQLKKKVKRGLMFEENYDELLFVPYVFNKNLSRQNGWCQKDYNGKFFTSEILIDKWLDIILEKMK